MDRQQIVLLIFAVLGLGAVAEGAWRLRRARPTAYASAAGEALVGILLAVVVLLLPGGDRWSVAAKAIAVVGFVAAAFFRLVGRNRQLVSR